MFQTVIHYVLEHRDAILQLVGGTTGLSAFAAVLLHKFRIKWDLFNGKIAAFILVQLLVGIGALVSFLELHTDLAVVYPWMVTAAAFIHRFLVSPAYNGYVLPWLQKRSATKEQFSEWLLTQRPGPELTPVESPVATPVDAQLV